MRLPIPIGVTAVCLSTATPCVASVDAVQRVKLPAQPLRRALQELARRYQVELLFSDEAIGSTAAPAVSGTYRIEQALAALLAGTGFVVRRSGSGGYIVVSEGGGASDNAMPEPAPEILVIGRKTQNADIRRRANDVQPYQVITRKDVQNAHAATIEELIGKRMSADQRGLSYSQTPLTGQGTPQSTINLRGLGTEQTLVLLDGRRLPRLPSRLVEFVQSDVNALSVESIERAEVNTSTAGGIYGPGAISGVVNLVLRRDYRGAEISATRGITQRGDAPYGSLDTRIGFTPDHGATDVMLAYSASVSGGLTVADRDYRQRADERLFAQPGTVFRSTDLPISNSFNVAGDSGTTLVLKPAYGGAALGSQLTSIAPGGSRSPSALGAELLANAGRLDYTPATSAGGGRQSLTVAKRTTAILANIRHRFAGLELYADLVRLIDRGQVTLPELSTTIRLSASDPRNPFLQPINVSFSVPTYGSTGGQRIAIMRTSVGALIDLPATWKANLDLSLGSARQTLATNGASYSAAGYFTVIGVPVPGILPLDPFGDSAVFQNSLAQLTAPVVATFDQTNRFSDATARFAGPVATLPGGALVATILFEQRRERVGASVERAETRNQVFAVPRRAYSERVRSAYLELRAPLLAEDAGFRPLRGLELQLAARRDATLASIGSDPFDDPAIAYKRFTAAQHAATVFTAGFKVKPVRGLMLRGSVATGENAPPLSAVANAIVFSVATDPKRGDRLIGSEGPYQFTVYQDEIQPERARSLSVGFILSPFRTGGPSLSLDYTRIRRSHEVNGSNIGDASFFVDNEALFPDRVTRLPLTSEDAAKGFTGGIITKLNASYLTIGHTEIDAVDARIDLPIRAAGGDLTLFGAATWQPRYTKFVLPQYPSLDYVNRPQGTLEWRGNGGATWAKGPLTLGLNGQYYGSYSVDQVSFSPDIISSERQGATKIPAQLTFDLSAAYRIGLDPVGGRSRTLEFRFGVQDVLDRRPTTVIAAQGRYSYYSDPRRRRFELTVATGF